jgi:hypothetical protein
VITDRWENDDNWVTAEGQHDLDTCHYIHPDTDNNCFVHPENQGNIENDGRWLPLRERLVEHYAHMHQYKRGELLWLGAIRDKKDKKFGPAACCYRDKYVATEL